MERAEQDSRWARFSSEELQELRNGAVERRERRALPDEVRDRAGYLAVELHHELRRRGSQSTYRGPGLYEVRGRLFEVLGTGGDPRVMGDSTQVVLRSYGDRSGVLVHEPLTEFNQVEDGVPAWAYVGPLEEGS